MNILQITHVAEDGIELLKDNPDRWVSLEFIGVIIVFGIIAAFTGLIIYKKTSNTSKIANSSIINGGGEKLIIDISEINATLTKLQVSIGKIETEIGNIKERLNKIE